MLRLHDLKGRVARLEKLARGLARELRLREAAAETLLLHRERRVYPSALADALAGADLARDVLTKAVRRLEGAAKQAPTPGAGTLTPMATSLPSGNR
jgi:hypothetical protein